MYTFLSIGADPEVFVTKGSDVISGEGLIGGSKEFPRELEPGYCVQEDNILLEYNIPPCTSREEFIMAINKGLTLGKGVLPIGHDISIQASSIIDPKWLQTEHAQMFGCDPDYNAYTEDENPKPCSKTNLRTAGGHVHIAYEPTEIGTTLILVRLCDLFLGIPSIVIDTDSRRRELYGKAGAFRFKAYGFEYRTLSNFWLQTDDRIGMIYDQIIKMFDFFNRDLYEYMTERDWIEIIEAINSSDKIKAQKIIDQYHIL